jgi:hypothetical protein
MLHVGRGITTEALTIFPIWSPGSTPRSYSTDTGALTVTEHEGGASVPVLSASHAGSVPVLVLEGHLFEGGWQHRMAQTTVLVASSGTTFVDVLCVEQSRWGGAVAHRARGRRATPFVRSGASAPGGRLDSQSEVWRRVSTYARPEDGNGTQSLVRHVDASRREVRRLVRDLAPLPGQSGILVGIAGQPVMLEVFDDPRTLDEQFISIIEAAGLDALGQAPGRTPSRRAHRMVRRLEQLSTSVLPNPGLGQREVATSGDLDVSALVWEGRPVHLRATYLRHPMMAGQA